MGEGKPDAGWSKNYIYLPRGE